MCCFNTLGGREQRGRLHPTARRHLPGGHGGARHPRVPQPVHHRRGAEDLRSSSHRQTGRVRHADAGEVTPFLRYGERGEDKRGERSGQETVRLRREFGIKCRCKDGRGADGVRGVFFLRLLEEGWSRGRSRSRSSIRPRPKAKSVA